MPQLDLHVVDGHHSYGVFDNIVLGVFRTYIPHESVLAQIEVQKGLLTSGRVIGLLNVIETGCKPLEARTRDVIGEWSKGAHFSKVRTANVIEQVGVGGTMLRMILRAIGLTVPKETRAMIFGDAPAGIAWIVANSEVAEGTSNDTIARAIDLMRKEVQVHAA